MLIFLSEFFDHTQIETFHRNIYHNISKTDNQATQRVLKNYWISRVNIRFIQAPTETVSYQFDIFTKKMYDGIQIYSSTIDDNVEYVLSVQLHSYVISVNLVFVSDKIIDKSDFKIKCLSFSYINALMSEHFVFLVIFDTCDVVNDLSISLLPPIALEYIWCNLDIWGLG